MLHIVFGNIAKQKCSDYSRLTSIRIVILSFTGAQNTRLGYSQPFSVLSGYTGQKTRTSSSLHCQGPPQLQSATVSAHSIAFFRTP